MPAPRLQICQRDSPDIRRHPPLNRFAHPLRRRSSQRPRHSRTGSMDYSRTGSGRGLCSCGPLRSRAVNLIAGALSNPFRKNPPRRHIFQPSKFLNDAANLFRQDAGSRTQPRPVFTVLLLEAVEIVVDGGAVAMQRPCYMGRLEASFPQSECNFPARLDQIRIAIIAKQFRFLDGVFRQNVSEDGLAYLSPCRPDCRFLLGVGHHAAPSGLCTSRPPDKGDLFARARWLTGYGSVMHAIAPLEDGMTAKPVIGGTVAVRAFVFADGIVEFCERDIKRRDLDDARHERDRREQLGSFDLRPWRTRRF